MSWKARVIRRMGSYMAAKVRLDPTPRQVRLMASHAGAAWFAYNAGLAHVKEAIGGGEPPEWSHYSLRRWWSANKDGLAVNQATGEVWWDQGSKEAYSGVLRGLARGFSNWSKSRQGGVRAVVSGSRSSSRRALPCGSRILPVSPLQRLVALTG